MRTIIFGDIHGCYEEWQDLLDKVKPASNDKLVCVGDMIAKGPSSRRVLDMAMRLGSALRCVQGNHEYALLKHWRAGKLKSLDEHFGEVIREFGADVDKYLHFIDSWPLYLELPECFVVHAGIRPGIPWNQQAPEDLVTLRTLEPGGEAWYDAYPGTKLIVHGHWAARGLVVRPNVIGLDSGCVYGRSLSAVVLPERQILSVSARRAYS